MISFFIFFVSPLPLILLLRQLLVFAGWEGSPFFFVGLFGGFEGFGVLVGLEQENFLYLLSTWGFLQVF